MSPTSRSHKKVTIKIPGPLYEKISTLIEDTGYNSVTDFITFVLRDLVGSANMDGPPGLERTKQKLKGLGYL